MSLDNVAVEQVDVFFQVTGVLIFALDNGGVLFWQKKVSTGAVELAHLAASHKLCCSVRVSCHNFRRLRMLGQPD